MSILVLLALIAVGLLTLSASVVRSSSQDRFATEARANAKLSLMLAIGELQKQLGPDRRVTARGDQLVEEGFAGRDVSDDKRYYVAAYSNEDLKSSASPGRRKEAFRRWLVSGAPEDLEALEFGLSALSGDRVEVVGASTVGGELSQRVEVPTVALKRAGGSQAGRYGWWVDDCGAKASVYLNGTAEEDLAHLAPERFGVHHVNGMEWLPDQDSADWSRVVSLESGELLGGAGESFDGQFHWLTMRHRAVLADVGRGGLKGDLTVALGDERAPMEKMVGERIFQAPGQTATSQGGTGGPFWEQVRQFYQAGGTDSMAVRPQTKDQMGVYPVIAGFVEMYGLSNTLGYAPSAAPHPTLPANHYNKRSNGKWAYVMTMHMTPVVKLWNPYNRPMEMPYGMTLSVMNNTAAYGSSSTSSYEDIMWWGRNGNHAHSIDARPPKTMRYEHRYFIPATELGPGEVRVFSLTKNTFLDLDGNYRTHTGQSVGHKTNVVPEGWILGELSDITETGFTGHCFWDLAFTKRDISSAGLFRFNWAGGRGIGGYGGADRGDIQILDSDNPGGLGFDVTPHSFATWNLKLYEGRAKLGRQGTPDSTLPLVNLKNINTDSTGFKKGNTAFVTNRNPAVLPFFAGQGGQDSIWARRAVMRMVLNEGDDVQDVYNQVAHPTKDAKWLANYNPRSPTAGCWAYEHRKAMVNKKLFTGSDAPLVIDGAPYQGANGYGLGTPGNYLSGMLPELTNPDALFLNEFVGFSDLGGPERCVLFEFPRESRPERHFFSIGQLRHANLWIENGSYAGALAAGHGDEDWFSDNMHPAYPIGNSYADPRLPFEQDGGRYLRLQIGNEASSYSGEHYDLSWFLNDALWDRYFFSARSGNGEGRSNNPRLVMRGADPLKDGTDGYERNASRLLLDGAFNVNSTSVEAWEAFLASLAGKDVNGRPADGAAFSRVSDPLGGEVSGNTEVDELDNYIGFRGLEPDELKELAFEIVEEVKERGPFLSLAEFVNRDTWQDGEERHRVKGCLQAAIDRTLINERQKGQGEFVIASGDVGSVYDQDAYAGDVAAGVPGYLTQGDVMARLGHLMTARSDTFCIRAYGEATDGSGKVMARAMCEATVQRVPEYVDGGVPVETRPESMSEGAVARRFGRRFQVTSFRWLSPEEQI